MFVPQPEVPTDAAKALLVLLPVPVEGDEATLSSLNDGPATTYCLHVTEHLEQRENILVGDPQRQECGGGLPLPSPIPVEPGDVCTSIVTQAHCGTVLPQCGQAGSECDLLRRNFHT